MKTQRLLLVLTVLNFVLLVVNLGQRMSAAPSDAPQVLRGSGLEIVDAQGRVRASISVNPAVVVDSKPYPESVLLRLRDPSGPTMKLDASSGGTGVRLGGGVEAGVVELAAKASGNWVRVTRQGHEQTLKP